jgi:hypothetical protein
LTFPFVCKNHQPESEDEAEDFDEALSLSSAFASSFVDAATLVWAADEAATFVAAAVEIFAAT